MNRQDVSNAYDELAAARAQEREQSISAAKEIDPDGLKGTTLENAPDLQQPFDQAVGRDGLGPPIGTGSQGIDSEQVRDSGANHDMRPPPEIANESDRDAHEEKMAKDDANINAYYESLGDSLESRQQGKSNEQNRDGPEMG